MRWTIVTMFLLVPLGCGPRAMAVRAPDARSMVRLERLAQQAMRCSAPLRVTSLEEGAYQLEGCGQMREYASVCSGRRCTFQPIVPAALRASSDLQCAPEQLQFAEQSPTHRAFFGCSRGAAYMLVCVDHGCTWSRTSEAVTVSAPSAPTYAGPSYVPAFDLSDVVIPPPPSPSASPSAAPQPVVIPPPPS